MNSINKFSLKLKNQINNYVDFVYKINQKFNLTGFKTKPKIYDHLVLDVIDCLTNLNIDLNFKNILDVGSGAGSPGIIMALLFPEANIYMVDSNNKKYSFIKEAIKIMSLKNAYAIYSRAENLDNRFINFFDLGISRAVDSIGVMNELIVKWIKLKGFIIHLKSKNYLEELEISKKNMDDLGLNLKNEINFMSRKIIFNNFIFQKIKNISSIYPRDWKTIKKDYHNV